MTSPERLAAISKLANDDAYEENLHTLVRRNDRIFLDPSKVGDVSSPLPKQLCFYLESQDEQTVLDFERALRTGVVDGAAVGDDDSESEDEDLVLAENWNDDPLAGWVTSLESRAGRADSFGVLTPDGECVGPLSVTAWLAQHLPPTRELLAAEVASEAGKDVGCFRAVMQLAQAFAAEVRYELRGRARPSHLCRNVPRLLLVVHFINEHMLVAGEGVPEADVEMARDVVERSLSCSYAAARELLMEVEFPGAGGVPGSCVSDLACLAFVTSELCEQEVEIERRAAARAANGGQMEDTSTPSLVDITAWTGDEDDQEEQLTVSRQLLRLAVECATS